MNKILKYKKAQITIEALLIFLISLTIIMIAFSTVNIIDKTQKRVAYSGILNMQADHIEEFVNQACILGDGNYYTLKLANINLKMKQKDKKTIEFETGSFISPSSISIDRTFLCDVVLDPEGVYKGKAFIWYEDGQVYISNAPKS